jgi:multidrug transporter EmrE-like cation transporter
MINILHSIAYALLSGLAAITVLSLPYAFGKDMAELNVGGFRILVLTVMVITFLLTL